MERYINIQAKPRGEPISIPGNPYALLDENGVVTEVVYMQEYSPAEIQETLSKHTYARHVICSEYGIEIFVGERWIGDVFVVQKPFKSWIIHPSTGFWVAPVQYPSDEQEYIWNEETLSWEVCAPCTQEPEQQDAILQEE